MDDSPAEVGALHVTLTSASPADADTIVAAPGTPRGTIGSEGVEAAPSPASLVATTVKVYDTPFVNPDTVHDNSPAVAHVAPPGDAVTV